MEPTEDTLLLELDKMDEREFRIEILAIKLTCKLSWIIRGVTV